MANVEHANNAVRAVINQALSRLADLNVRAEWTDGDNIYGHAVSGTLTVDTGDSRFDFPAITSPKISPADLSLLPHDPQTILLTDRVTPARAQELHQRGWGGYADSAGNASLRSDGLVIEMTGKRGPEANRPASSAAPFTKTGLPVTFTLLVAHDFYGHTPSQRSLAMSSGASVGTVNRVIRALRERVPPILDEEGNEFLRLSALEDEWISAYSAMQPSAWPEERFTSDVWKNPSDVLDAVLPPGALLGSEIAAARLGAPIRPASALIHFDGDAHQWKALTRQGRLRRAEDGWIRIRPALWKTLPVPPKNGTAPKLLIRADLLLENDPRLDEIRTQYFGADR
ncbi:MULTISPECIES: type IV toxin-antitoxin system AbiEi family antitoxin [Brevibacterium]|nr:MULTISPECIES: type IV toxin-antitoxin system AbiEi family antitoxin [Brevibacterium]